MLVRKIAREIERWIDNSRKALIIYGARQVGKMPTAAGSTCRLRPKDGRKI